MDTAHTLEQELERLKRENELLRAECLRNRRQELSGHLLGGEFLSPEQIASDLRQVGCDLYRESYLEIYVNVLMLPPPPEKQPDDTYRPASGFRAVFEDGLEALIRETFPDSFCMATRWRTGVAAILQFDKKRPVPSEAGNFILDLNQKALQLVDTLNAQHGLEVFVALSRPHEGVGGIPEAHQEIQKINNYRSVMGIDVPVLCYHDFEMAESDQLSDFNTLQLERTYLTSVELGEFEQARTALQELIDLEFHRAVPALDSLQAKISSKLGLLLIALERFQSEEKAALYGEVLNMQTALSQDELTIEDLRRKIDYIFDWIADLVTQQQAPKWLQVLLRYVDENYTRSELNVASIAETLGLNPSYLSREVKRCTGSGLLDLLQKKRLDRAVALLSDGSSMTDAAQKSGFGNLRTLRRAMKRYRSGPETAVGTA
jgi:AraC-like DNA-binding protein